MKVRYKRLDAMGIGDEELDEVAKTLVDTKAAYLPFVMVPVAV